MLLQKCVKKLHFGSWEEKEVAAKVIEEGLAKQDVKVREMASELGVVRVLVSMAVSEVASRRRVGLRALIHLSNGGNHRNKVLILEAGISSKLPKKIDLEDESISEFAHLLSSLSSLGNIQFRHSSLHFLQFLIDILKSCSSFDTKQSCLVALCNISSLLENAGPLVSNGVVPILLEMSLMKGRTSEKALTILGNLGVTLIGKKAIENSSMVPKCLIEILTWEDKPKCQEFSSYILVILAHKSSTQREKMLQSGIVPVLLEVALVGSSLAQKSALKLLQCFKDERKIKMGPHSGPQTSRTAKESIVKQRDTKEGKRMMKKIVVESLHKNMEIITKRAHGAEDDSNKLKSLVITTSSKSLPY
ncbi:U-box domain-containing protein 7 [Glycine soja]